MGEEQIEIATKKQFAEIAGVSAARVSQWLSSGQINGPALVGEGRHARIRTEVALHQLRLRLDADQRIANGTARLGRPKGSNGVLDNTVAPSSANAEPTLEERLKRQRLEQLELANEKAREEASARAGTYARADDVRREMGRLVGKLITVFDGALVEFSAAVAARSDLSSRDALHLLRSAWRSIRERAAENEQALADALPGCVGGDSSSPETTNQRAPGGQGEASAEGMSP
jgi:hypothetical protein